MSISLLPDAELITLGNRVIESSANPEIAEVMAAYGYDSTAVQKGRSLLDAYATDYRRRTNEYGEQISATEALGDAWEAFHDDTYMPHVTIARLIFDPDGPQKRLGIKAERADAFGPYVRQAQTFYDTIADNPEIQEALAARGVTAEDVAAAQADLAQLEHLNKVQEDQKSDAEQATRRRNDARSSFTTWLSRYQEFAKVALRDHPELLERVGVNVRTN